MHQLQTQNKNITYNNKAKTAYNFNWLLLHKILFVKKLSQIITHAQVLTLGIVTNVTDISQPLYQSFCFFTYVTSYPYLLLSYPYCRFDLPVMEEEMKQAG